jgi:3',5'-cyclic AMP phosphodiesterase CpdA
VRDLSILGHLSSEQIAHARKRFDATPAGDARVIVMHHNPVKGELSQRHGLKHTQRILGAFAQIGVDLILCGHDHQEAIHFVEHTKRGTVISTAGTVSNRSRGGRPSSVNVVTITAAAITVHTLTWSYRRHELLHGASRTFARHAVD